MKNTKGFTFVEMLIVLGIIALLATATVVLLNPAKRFEAARDKQREIHLQAILSAIERKMTVEAGWFDEEKCDPLPQETKKEIVDEKEVEVAIFKTIGNKRDDNDPEKIHPDYYDLFECLVPKYMVNPLYDPDGGNEEDTHYQIWQNPQTKYVTLRYVKEEPFKEIVAGAKKYGILSAPRHVETAGVTEVGHTTAKGGGTVYDDGGAYVFEAGVIWAKTADLSDCETDLIFENVDMGTILRTIDGAGSATEGETSFNFDSNLHSLQGGVVDYCVRAYARNEIGVGYGDPVQFATLDVGPEVYTFEDVYVGADIAEVEGEIRSLGIEHKVVSEAYFCYEQTDTPFDQDPNYCPIKKSVAWNITTEPFFLSTDLTGLDPGTPYHFKACAYNAVEGTLCGEVYGFTTLPVSPPFVDTLGEERMTIYPESAEVGGEITSTGGLPIMTHGVCFHDVFSDPCRSDLIGTPWCVGASGGGIGEFFLWIENLTPGNEYYVCAYADNGPEGGLSWGRPAEPFQAAIVKPDVTTKSVSSITHSSAESGGIVESGGGATVNRWGVCWERSTIGDPEDTVDPESNPLNCTVNDSPGWDDFTSPISVYSDGLWGSTAYNVQAYAINSQGTGWGDPESFTTDPPVKPGLTTKEPSEFGPTSAESGGDVIDHGGAPIVGLGVCWVEGSPDVEPELTYETAEDCPGVNAINKGSFSITIENLYPGRTYWVRAFARNRDVSEYGYGDMFSFTTTPPDPPTVRNVGEGPTESGSDWAKIEGEVTNDGGDSSTERGICYGTNHLPTFDYLEGGGRCLYHEIGGIRTTGKGKFEVTINDLEAGVQYYARAFAINTAGLVYADGEIPFSTAKPDGSTCTDSSQCESNICNREGICCSTPCDTPCWSCKVELNVGTCSHVPAGEDWGEGPEGDCQRTMTCDGPCKAYGDPGYCNGGGACAPYVSAEYAPDDGQVCYGNGEWKYAKDLTKTDQFCGIFNNCTAGNCTGYIYYRGCKANTTVAECTATNQLTETVKALSISESFGKVLDSSCQIVSGYCGTCCYCSNGSKTARSEDTYATGCATCRVCDGTEKTTCSKTVVKSTWGSGSYGCDNQSMCVNGECLAGDRYYLYVTNVKYEGNLGGRDGADAKCNADAYEPTACTRAGWAFISVKSTDEIRDFPSPTSKSVATFLPWYWRKGSSTMKADHNFYDLLDGSVINRATDVGYSSHYWTGSTYRGYLHDNYCDQWYSQAYDDMGQYGNYWQTSLGLWLSYDNYHCSWTRSILCACIGIE